MDIVVRLATSCDASDVAEVHMRSWEAAYKDIIPADFIREKNAGRPALWENILGNDNTTQYIIKKNGNTVGMMGMSVSQDEDVDDGTYELTGLYLLPEYFYQGIGTRAMEVAFEKAQNLEMKDMTVWLLENNHNAKRFYEKCGFVHDKRMKTIFK